jgi:Kef-type K+ transport system membrane component KefB
MTSHGDTTLLMLLILLSISILGPVAAVRLRLPTAVILIVSGIFIGPAGLGVVTASGVIAFLSEFGFLVLMFMAGMEIDFEVIRAAGLRALLVPSLVVAGIFVIASIAVRVLGLSPTFGLAVSAMSVGLPLAVLKETRHDATALGRHVMLTASLGEFVCILAITGVELAIGEAVGWHTVVRILKVAALFAFCTLVIRWVRALVWWHPELFRRLIHHHDVAELGVRVGLVIMLVFVAMSALAGMEPILGAFLGGTLVGFVLRQKQVLEGKIAALGNGLFIPIFFVVVGVRFDVRALDLAAVRQALIIVGVAGLAKLVPSLIFASRGTPLRTRLAAGCLLSAPLTLVVAIAAIGRQLHLIDGPAQACLILVAMVASVLFPTLFKLIAPGSDADAAVAAPRLGVLSRS